MKRSERRFSGRVAHVSKRGTELRFENNPRRFQAFKKSAGAFSGIVPGDYVILAWGLNGFDTLRTGRIMHHDIVSR